MDNENTYIILNYNHHLKFFKLYSTCLIWLLKMHLKNSSCTNHTDDLKISIWHTHLLHCALSQKIKVWWKKWILIELIIDQLHCLFGGILIMIWKLWPIYLFKENEMHSTKAFVLHWLLFTGFTSHQLILLNEQLCKWMWKF